MENDFVLPIKFPRFKTPAEKFEDRRKTPPLTPEELKQHDAYCRALDPVGEFGDRILARQLRAMDVVKELCKSNPNKPKIRAAIQAELAACEADQQLISQEAIAQREASGIKSPFSDLGDEHAALRKTDTGLPEGSPEVSASGLGDGLASA